ncbi:hypothetical protein EVAR_44817_1 [Eumeta japonica]|uniref:Uncharacterized protein n=1 Tax=Eumeta variegata TaxID=151549 RepID=A0A4C1X746_EUMVA|nr:hypothetical protein EVAR_44817_1 [Eumeta japonica]
MYVTVLSDGGSGGGGSQRYGLFKKEECRREDGPEVPDSKRQSTRSHRRSRVVSSVIAKLVLETATDRHRQRDDDVGDQPLNVIFEL